MYIHNIPHPHLEKTGVAWTDTYTRHSRHLYVYTGKKKVAKHVSTYVSLHKLTCADTFFLFLESILGFRVCIHQPFLRTFLGLVLQIFLYLEVFDVQIRSYVTFKFTKSGKKGNEYSCECFVNTGPEFSLLLDRKYLIDP